MRYLKSTSGRSYVVNGKVIPPNSKPEWLGVNNDEFEAIKKVVVINGLIASGGILVTDKEPAEMARTPGALLNANGKLKQENAELKAELEKLKAEHETALQGNEAAQALEASRAEAEGLRKELEEQKAAYAALEQEAKTTIADLNEKIASLKQSTKKAAKQE